MPGRRESGAGSCPVPIPDPGPRTPDPAPKAYDSRVTRRLLLLVAFVLAAASPQAQEGHPLTGTWGGDWGPADGERTHLTLVVAWEGDTLTATVNPGIEPVALTRVELNPGTWTVHLEGIGKDESGQPVAIAADGRLEDLGSYHRRLVGTWTQGTAKGTFTLTRE